MKKKVIAALLSVGMILSVVACGTTEQGSTEQKVSSEAKPSESAASEEVKTDELAWLDTPRSGFIHAFEASWNTWGCHRKNLMVIVCGSANSWIQDKLLNNHGGLYNRVTYEIKLSPFNLKECEEFYKSNNVILSRYDVAQSSS